MNDPVPAEYPALVAELKERIHGARMRATLAVNEGLVRLYWDIGRAITTRLVEEGWGRATIERLSADLRQAFPDAKGFSPRNLWRMRAFYSAWARQDEVLPQAVAELPWGHNAVLLEKLDGREERLWYAQKARQHGWSRAILVMQIETALHKRQAKAVTNFDRTLPAPQSDLANQLLKDPYLFGFLGLEEDAQGGG